jgi:hypothetical protein
MQLLKIELEHVVTFHSGKLEKLEAIIENPTLEIGGYSIPKQVGRTLPKRTYVASIQ